MLILGPLKVKEPVFVMKKLLRVLFGRTLFLVLSLVIQAIVLLSFMLKLSDYLYVYYGFSMIVALLFSAHIANLDISSSVRMSWIAVVFALPVFGVLFYLFIDLQPTIKLINKRIEYLIKETKPYLVQKAIFEKDSHLIGLSNYMNNYAGFPIYNNSDVKYLKSGEEKYDELLIELKKAEKFIFLEYFIIDEGKMWDSILEILKAKAKEGVQVRLMYDGTCMFSLLPHSYPKQMEKFGIKCRVFSPLRPALTTYQNNRDHRKIVVVDGKVAFTGGINLADEYINEIKRFGHWKDNAVKITGEAVRSFTIMFLQMWNIGEKGSNEYEKYLTEEPVEGVKGYVMPYGDHPFDEEYVGEYVYMDILNKASRYVHIMTPYLIPSNEMVRCLENASKRGVDVKIIMPYITDKPSAYYIARTFYPKLIEKGIEIYEYTPGFVHAKTFVADDKKAVVGTINMDFRSLYQNLECAAYMEEVEAIKDIEIDYQETLKQCHKMTLEECNKYNPILKLIGKLLWIISPLM